VSGPSTARYVRKIRLAKIRLVKVTLGGKSDWLKSDCEEFILVKSDCEEIILVKSDCEEIILMKVSLGGNQTGESQI
jgi:hypothetical protein